jgi:hypothetical protein
VNDRVILDNEAVQALSDPFHRKHNTVIGLLQIAESRRRGGTVRVVVPTSVRVESGWNRDGHAAAAINRHRVTDHVLDRRTADVAASIRRLLGVSVADAHIGAAIREQQGTTRVITSDPRDIRLAAGDAPIIVIAI